MSIKFIDVLNNRFYADVLYKFTKREASNENFEFLYCVRQLNPTKGIAHYKMIPANLTTVNDKAEYIYNRFIEPSNSLTSRRNAININTPTKNYINQVRTGGNWTAQSFNNAYDAIFSLMHSDTYPRFAKSSEVNDSPNLRGFRGQFSLA